ncbi:TetR/AcrR family transcriptional regulator [Actinokineospora sp. G85]|uniref:TetR/AcrR family transcriptional regulator n=1 Tax=Actinokineospora sp. G85 TaxID=3406626 RepID=UPI003C74B3BB
MQVNTGGTGVEQARRAQIAEAAIEVIADLGFAGASFARIVERAGLSSTRMISYHFVDKSDLVMAVLITAIAAADEVLDARVAGVTDRVELLRAHIEARVEFLRTHPKHLRAIVEVGTGSREPLHAAVLADFRVGRLRRQLVQGQREGAFAPFDPGLVAEVVASALDGLARGGGDLADGPALADFLIRAIRA